MSPLHNPSVAYKNATMSFDQYIQVWNTVGTWFAGIGTCIAVAIALWLARRAEKVRLKCYVGHGLLIGGGDAKEVLRFHITNIGERPVTIDSVGWRIGRGKNRLHAMQLRSSPDELPKKIEYGETVSFRIDFSDWIEEFCKKILQDKPVKTLRAQIHTSIGYTENVKPERNLLDKLREVQVGSK